ncbi:MAG: hypothetical protein AB3X44_16200 [Leptothrix sp. (in: b-proteobacteria)]
MSIEFEPGLAKKHRSLRDCVAQGVYQRGLKVIAADLDWAPGNLSVALSDEGTRKFDLADLEQYIETAHDYTPIFYLIDRFLGDQQSMHSEAMQRVATMLEGLPALLASAGIKQQPAKVRR